MSGVKLNKIKTRRQMRIIALKYLDARRYGHNRDDAARHLGITSNAIDRYIKNSDLPSISEVVKSGIPDGPWQETVRGKTWDEMPGNSPELQKLNFFFWRRGLYFTQKEQDQADRKRAERENLLKN